LPVVSLAVGIGVDYGIYFYDVIQHEVYDKGRNLRDASRLVVADAADIWIYNAIELRGLSNRLRGFRFTPIGSGADFRIMSLTG